MAAMLGEVYDALIAAGAPADKARLAAEAIATHGERFGKIEREHVDLRADMKAEFASVKAELTLIKWMGGVIVAGVAALILRAFS